MKKLPIYKILAGILLWPIAALVYESLSDNTIWWTGFKSGLIIMLFPTIGNMILFLYLRKRNGKNKANEVI